MPPQGGSLQRPVSPSRQPALTSMANGVPVWNGLHQNHRHLGALRAARLHPFRPPLRRDEAVVVGHVVIVGVVTRSAGRSPPIPNRIHHCNRDAGSTGDQHGRRIVAIIGRLPIRMRQIIWSIGVMPHISRSSRRVCAASQARIGLRGGALGGLHTTLRHGALDHGVQR